MCQQPTHLVMAAIHKCNMKGQMKMNKPLTMTIKETKSKLINACNESGLPLAILDLVVQNVYSEIHYLSEKQAREEEVVYRNTLEDNDKNVENIEQNN